MTVKGEAHFPSLREIDLSYQIIKSRLVVEQVERKSGRKAKSNKKKREGKERLEIEDKKKLPGLHKQSPYSPQIEKISERTKVITKEK
jgi:hypothetical protein